MGIKEEGEREGNDKSAATDRDIDAIQVSKYMTKTVTTASLDQTIQSVCKIMNENNLGGLVIVKRGVRGNEPVGIITERDIIRKIGEVELFTTQTSIRELMSKNLISIKPDNTISDAIELMHGNNIRRLPVIDNDGKMVGIITDKDILKAAARKGTIVTAYIPEEFNVEDQDTQ
jgi:CBS domain-containing protein